MPLTHQRSVIDGIRAEYGVDPVTGDVANSLLYNTLKAALETLSDTLNSDISHFLLELIQNADDLKYSPSVTPLLKFELIGFDLLVISNEAGFTEEDVRAICAAGMSTKAGGDDTTGEKGIGFKSLFKAAEEVTVSSNGFCFQFSRARTCGLVIPAWKKLPKAFRRPDLEDKTVFLLHFASQQKLAKVKEDLQHFDAKMLLFLRRLRCIEIEVDEQMTSVTRVDSQSVTGPMTQLQAQEIDGKVTRTSFAIVSHTCKVTVNDCKRQNRLQSTVALAFPVNGDVQGAHAYNVLPICETGYPFLVQADFILVGSREALDFGHGSWNQMLFDALSQAFLAAIRRFHQSPDMRYRWLRYLPLNPGPAQFRNLVTTIQKTLRDSPSLLTHDAAECHPQKAWFVPEAWRDNLGPLVQVPTLNPPNISTSYQPGAWKYFEWLGCRYPTAKASFMRFKYYLSCEDGKIYHQQSLDRLVSFAKVLSEYKLGELEILPILPLSDGRWSASKDKSIFYPYSKFDETAAIDMPRGLPDVDILHPSYITTKESPLHQLFSKVGVKEASVAEISRIIQRFHSGPKTTNPRFRPSELVEQLIYLFKAWKSGKYFECVPKLHILTEAQKAPEGNQLYQPRLLCREGLAELLTDTQAAGLFMNPMYLRQVAPEDLAKFSEWLQKYVGAFSELRICSASNQNAPTPEFVKLISCEYLPKAKILSMIVDAWDTNFRSLAAVPQTVENTLKSMPVLHLHGNLIMLEHAFLPTKAIKDQLPEGIPYLDVDDPENKRWQVLKKFGVITAYSSQSSALWLSCLRAVMLQPHPQRATLIKIYQRLSQCATGDTIQFFQKQRAIFIPSKNQWVSCADSIWTSTLSLRHHCTLSSEYPASLRTFFRDHLKIQNAHIGHFAEELKLWSNEDDVEHVYLKALVLAMAEVHETSASDLGETGVRKILQNLRHQRMIPVIRVQNGQVEHQTATMEDATRRWFMVDSLRLKAAFQESVWLADFGIEKSATMVKWMKRISSVFPKLRPTLTQAVTEIQEHSGLEGEVTTLTHLLNSRSCYMGSVAAQDLETTQNLQAKVDKLSTVRVYSTQAITTRFSITLGGRKMEGKPEQKADIMIHAEADSLEVLVSAKAATYDQLPPDAGTHLCSYLGISSHHVILLFHRVLTALDTDDVRDLLVKHEIAIPKEAALEKKSIDNADFIGAVSSPPRNGDNAHDGGDMASLQLPLPKAAASTDQMSAADAPLGKSTRKQPRPRTSPRKCHSQSTSRVPMSLSSGPHRTTGANKTIEASSAPPDPTSGIKGELFVYYQLNAALPGRLTADNWTSELRHLAQPELGEWTPPDSTTFFADFTIIDTDRTVSQWLEHTSQLDLSSLPDNHNKPIRFHIEVKSTSGSLHDPFHMSDWQLEAAKTMRDNPQTVLPDGRTVTDIFLLCIVSNIHGERPEWHIIPDFWETWLAGDIVVRAPQGLLVWKT